VVLFRDPEKPHVVRRLTTNDLQRIEKGTYSEFYQRRERFLDGSLFLPSQRDVRKHRAKLEQLTESVSAWVVNNVGSPTETARQILDAIEAEA
jgi:phosphoserine phosphatase